MTQSFASLEKALDILCLFNLETPEISAKEISRRMGYPQSTTYKYLEILLKKGFLAKSAETNKYMLGLTIFNMVNYSIAGRKLVDVAIDEMHALSEFSGESVMLTVLKGMETMCLEKVESKRLIKIGMERGATRPLYAGATAKTLLAHQKKKFIDDYLVRLHLDKLSANTVTDKDRLLDQLEEIRRQGYAYSDSEVENGAFSVGAPIFNHKKIIVAAITVLGPKDRNDDESITRLIAPVKDAARTISRNLGCPGR